MSAIVRRFSACDRTIGPFSNCSRIPRLKCVLQKSDGTRRHNTTGGRMRVKQFLSAWLKKSLAIAALAAAVSFLAMTPAEAITYGGSATGAEVTVSATNTTIRAAT